ncbi:mandelate racemase/muconate lactonizing enzyme family protein [Confluentibacter sediminis]|uniref:mandelate racemase/muconate lactonizing enzyme family protein n=1 Tax=Confluentibacter sediminis TaxID=2219045 RepID=UPI000DAE7612|nr:mandelate racemase/muconate lactonizing enzyme family protein [Confluentibacter sediminis]
MANSNSRRAFITKTAMAASLAPLATFGTTYTNKIDDQPKLSAPSSIKITDVQCGIIGGSLFVKIHSDQGIYGCGEGVDAIRGAESLALGFGRRLRGQSPFNVHKIFEDIRRGGHFGGGQSGMYVAVLSAIETALWDLSGKALDLPVYQLLGGKFRDKVRVYCDTALYRVRFPKPEDFAKAGQEAIKNWGFNALKFDLDYAGDPDKYDRYNWTASPGEISRMYDQLAAVRQAVGPKIDLCVDMHGRYDHVTAQAIAKKVEPLNLTWLEEPIPAENFDAFKTLTEETNTPIAAGENVYLGYGFKQLLDNGVDVVMPDLQKCGGLGEGQRIANLANLYYVPFSPHMVASFLGAMACAHVCASVPNFHLMEWQSYFHTDEMYKKIVIFDEGDWVKDSFVTVSNKPGIGVDLNIEAMREYKRGNAPFFEENN